MKILKSITSNFLLLFATCFFANANNGILETKVIGDTLRLVTLEEDLTGGTTSSPYLVNPSKPNLQIRWFDSPKIDVREKTDSGMYFEVSQPQVGDGEYNYSLGFDFGDDNGTASGGVPYTVDLTHQSIELRFKAKNLGDSTIQIRVALEDIYGNQVNTFKYNIDGDIQYDLQPNWGGDFKMDLYPGEEQYLHDAYEEGYIQMQQGYFKYWSQRNALHYCRPCHDIRDELDESDTEFENENFFKTGLRTFDYSKVSGFLITVLNQNNNGARDTLMNPFPLRGNERDEYNSYQRLALDDYPILITRLSIYIEPMAGNITYRTNPDEYNEYPDNRISDRDLDGIINQNDHCPYTPYGDPVDSKGCERDKDKDGVANELDSCPNTIRGLEVNIYGCNTDFDSDGIINELDQCPLSYKGAVVNDKGCESDSDQDGIIDSRDQCPNSLETDTVDGLGCVPLRQNFTRYGYGCMDPLALNYTPYTACPGVCVYPAKSIPKTIIGCMDKSATNYNPFANKEATCYYSLPTIGCTDSKAINYNSLAEVDDKSCEYGIKGDIMGCTDNFAYNFNLEATIDNGTCEYYKEYLDTATVIYGCRNINALNYSFNATFDDGSCILEQDTVENKIILSEEIGDTIQNSIDFCEFNYGMLVDSVVLSDVEILEDTLESEWNIYQRGIPTRVVSRQARRALPSNETSLLYLNMECEGANARIEQSRNLTFRGVYRVQGVNSIEKSVSQNSIKTIPNPFEDQIEIHSSLEGSVFVSFIDSKGIIVFSKSILLENGNGSINTSTLPKGTYILEVQNNYGVERIKVIK